MIVRDIGTRGATPTRSNYVRLEEVLGNSLHPFEAGHPDLHDDLHALRGRCALELGPRHGRFLLILAFRVHGVVRRLVPLAEHFVAAGALPVNALAVGRVGVDNSETMEAGGASVFVQTNT